MPRSSSGVFSAPAGTLATPITKIESAKHNAFVNDLVADANLARPIVAGGTGASTAAGARANLGLTAIPGGNRVINGNFSVNQRPVSGTVTLAAGAYGHDRWKAGASGCTYTFATAANVTTLTITAGSLVQVIEGANLFSDVHVLSWTGTAQGKIGAGSFGASGIAASVTGGTNLAIEFNTGAVSQVQLEAGPIATAFERRPVGAELALCQRYYTKGLGEGHVGYAPISGGTNTRRFFVQFPTTMRGNPTVTGAQASNIGPLGATVITTNSLQLFGTAGADIESTMFGTMELDAEL